MTLIQPFRINIFRDLSSRACVTGSCFGRRMTPVSISGSWDYTFEELNSSCSASFIYLFICFWRSQRPVLPSQHWRIRKQRMNKSESCPKTGCRCGDIVSVWKSLEGWLLTNVSGWERFALAHFQGRSVFLLCLVPSKYYIRIHS